MFLTVCLNPTLQKTLCFSSVTPNAVNRTAVHRLDVSGKGINVTRVLTQLGKEAVHLTQLGGDMKPLFLSLCEQDKLAIEWVESNSQIRFCYTLLTEIDGNVTELVEESESVTPETENLLLEKYDAIISNNCISSASCSVPSAHCSLLTANCIIISGTKAAGFSETIIPFMVQKAKEKGMKIILDIKGNDLKECLKYEPDVIKPNMEEFTDTFKTKPTKEMLIDISQKYKCNIILTDGGKKIIAAEQDNYFEIGIEPIKAVNTIGCGDAFTAGLAAALSDGADLITAIQEGKRCGALNAGLLKPGVIQYI